METKVEANYPVLYNSKEECCGCFACASVCASDAIYMMVDEEGFSYPALNKEKCVKCYKCIAVCSFKKG